MTTKTVKDTSRVAYWREMVDKWRTSGQTPEAFCRQRHVKAGTFAWWRSRLGRSVRSIGVRSSASDSVAWSSRLRASSEFVEVRRPTAGDESDSSRYEVALANGRRIVIRGDFSESILRRLIAAVEGPGC